MQIRIYFALVCASLLPYVFSQGCDYCSLDAKNTYCRFTGVSSSCGKIFRSEVNAEERQEVLDIHNDYRRKIAKQQQPNFGYAAADMIKLEWDEELARGAKLWAEQCDFKHDSNDICRFNVGQNLYIEGNRDRQTASHWSQALAGWFDEVNDFSGNPARFSGALGTGHFTQMIWASTRYVGCHFIKHSGYLGSPRYNAGYYVCNYGPAGNFMGEPIFEIGGACSRCPGNSVCDNGLCSFASTSATAPAPAPRPTVTTKRPTQTQKPFPQLDFPLPDLSIPTTTTTTTTTTTATTPVPARNPACDLGRVTSYLEECYGSGCNPSCDVKKANAYLKACFA